MVVLFVQLAFVSERMTELPFKVKLIESELPFRYKGHFTNYQKGQEFEVIAIKNLKGVGEFWKVKAFGVVFDDWINPNVFEIVEEK
jgi:hypothetical protein